MIHAVAERELGVADAAVGLVDRDGLEAERLLQPGDGGVGVAVAECGVDAHAAHATRGLQVRDGNTRPVPPDEREQLAGRDAGELAEVAVEVRLVVVAAVQGDVRPAVPARAAGAPSRGGSASPARRPSARRRRGRGSAPRGGGGCSPARRRATPTGRRPWVSASRRHARCDVGRRGGSRQQRGADRGVEQREALVPAAPPRRAARATRPDPPEHVVEREHAPGDLVHRQRRAASARPAASGSTSTPRETPSCSVIVTGACRPTRNAPKVSSAARGSSG